MVRGFPLNPHPKVLSDIYPAPFAASFSTVAACPSPSA